MYLLGELDNVRRHFWLSQLKSGILGGVSAISFSWAEDTATAKCRHHKQNSQVSCSKELSSFKMSTLPEKSCPGAAASS